MSNPVSRRLLEDSPPWLVVLGVAGLYLVTRAASPIPGDPTELVVAAATLGVGHPTGYPLYVLLGKVATLALGFSSPAAVLNALSAAYLVVALVLMLVLLRRLGVSAGATAAAIAVLGTTPSLWSSATVAEVYTLHVLLLAVVLVLLDGAVARPSTARVAGVFLVAGLALGNHMTSLLLVPGLLLGLLQLVRSGRLPKGVATVAAPAAAYLAGACVLLLLFALDHSGGYNYIDQYAVEFPAPLFASPLARVAWLLSGAQYGAASGFLPGLFSSGVLAGLAKVVGGILRDNAVLVLGGLVGLAATVLRRRGAPPRMRVLARFLLVTAVLNVVYLATYAARFETAFCAQIYLCCAVGLAFLVDRELRLPRVRTLVSGCLILGAAVLAGRHLVAIDKGGSEVYERETARLLAAVEPDAVLFTTWRNSTLLWYEQWVEGLARGVTVVNARPSSWVRLARGYPGRPLYFESVPAGVDAAQFRAVRHLFVYLPSLRRGSDARTRS